MAQPREQEAKIAAQSLNQLRRFCHLSNADKVFGTHRRAFAYYFLRDWERAESYGKQATHFANAHFWAYAVHAAALAQGNRAREGHAVLQKIWDAKPNFSVDIVRGTVPFNASMMELFIDRLRKAGIEER